MVDYPNFYENIQEAVNRIHGTVVMYDSQPYLVLAITNHKPDGIFRVYLRELGYRDDDGYPSDLQNYPMGSAELGVYLDGYLEKNKKVPILRKMMNSPLFNKFRPFPLGMSNHGNTCHYLQRQPNRQREQGLTRQSIVVGNFTNPTPQGMRATYQGSLDNLAVRDCILGLYPSYEECVKNLRDPLVENMAVGFDRDFALMRGPLELLFLVYKETPIGLVEQDGSLLLAKKFKQYREVTTELGVFPLIKIQN